MLAGATLEKDRKGNVPLKKTTTANLFHTKFSTTTSYYARSITHRDIRETKKIRPLFWPSEYLLTIPNNLEQSGRFCQSKLLRGNGSVGWPRYASHACTSNTIVLSARLAEYYRSRVLSYSGSPLTEYEVAPRSISRVLRIFPSRRV